MKRTFRTALLLSLGLLLSPTLQAQTAVAPPSSVNTQKMNQFVEGLMKKMTLDEKIGQLNLVSVGFDVTGPVVSKDVDANIRKGNVGAVLNTYTPVAARKLQELAVKESRLKIPLILGYDVIHGHRTILPIPLGMAASWDMPAMERGARIAAEEAAADGINWVYSPMVDIARDPRWGRIAEGAGEDPYLGSQIARAMVRGYQGTDNDMTKPTNVMACLKHFALYGAAEAGRDYNTTDMSMVRMYNEYLPPYKAAIEAGVGSVMTSFNDINGVPATGNKWLMTDLLRTQWGFNGFVATDYTAINEMVAHGMGNDAQVSALALNAGTDQDMVGEIFLKNLAQNLKAGTVKQEQIDLACRRVLEAKYKLGLFQDPYRGVTEKRAKATMMKKEFIADARSISRKSLVLLKNDKNTLPLKKTGTIALIGPLANRQRDMIGSWSGAGDWKQAISLEQGIKNVAGNGVKIVYAHGANVTDDAQMIERSWGLTASDSYKGYAAHSPTEDLGVISPTAALSAMPYAPAESMAALKHFYNGLGDKIWSEYGFVDGFSEHHDWYAKSHLAIDQGPIVVMIENHRTGLLWKLFMSSPDVQRGLTKLGFESPQIKK